ncbi:cadmium resistance transporter [Pseudonocardia halophobica]|uniref:Cadmium transporter n=1 Tax=Pseudonocardia halophobica TaxID=29401 RepID=A0A9W6L1I7_9PSEU|nr:cadmium resistance transporter [Pseudonocardia halophobica]GLL11115.1 cadmium transporter [Pseudonocardia halophobica]
MQLGVVGQAAGIFAVTNVDDLLLLALWFGRAPDRRAAGKVVAGQYLGFGAILAASLLGAVGAGFLPSGVVPYLGLLPILLGLRAARGAWRARRDGEGGDEDDDEDDEGDEPGGGTGLLAVAAVTLANGGDNIGVYVPVFASTDSVGLVIYAVVFLLLVGVWCAAGRFLATRPFVARAISRWGHVLLPVVLIAIGVLVLVEGGAFGLGRTGPG